MSHLTNPLRGIGLPAAARLPDGGIETDAAAAMALFGRCPVAAETPLLDMPELAREAGIGAVALKDERGRMGLGSFKALGAAFAIAKRAAVRAGEPSEALRGVTYVCASAGNHGLSMAAGARVFGASAVVYLAETVPEAFASLLREKGARVVREGATYEDSMAAAMRAAEANGWRHLPDSSWPGCTAPARDVMEGYLVIGEEAARQIAAPPSHIFLQAGVGGLAAAMAASARAHWGDGPRIAVVEPEAAPALLESIRAGRRVTAPGPVSAMGRLDCKVPSGLALEYLAREADAFLTVTDAEAVEAAALLARHGIETSPSGAAGVAGMLAAAPGPQARVLAVISEGPVDGCTETQSPK